MGARAAGLGVCLLAALRTAQAWSALTPALPAPAQRAWLAALRPRAARLPRPGPARAGGEGRRVPALPRQAALPGAPGLGLARMMTSAAPEAGSFGLLEGLPDAEMECWRPTADDVDRISWGRPAKKKMTGSRGVPHRLNEEERFLYDMAKRKGFLEVAGSGWRKQRRGAPLVNTFRSWCDSRGVPVVTLHKGGGGDDEVVVDLSPLRTPSQFQDIALKCAGAAPGGMVEALEGAEEGDALAELSQEEGEGDGAMVGGGLMDEELLKAYITEPIYRLPMFCVTWSIPRSEAKKLCKGLGEAFGVPEPTGKGAPNTLGRGMPNVKPGKNRRHGGFGIGSKGSKPRRQPREDKF